MRVRSKVIYLKYFYGCSTETNYTTNLNNFVFLKGLRRRLAH